MQKRILFGIVILVLILVTLGICHVYKPHQNAAGETAVASFTAPELYREFQNDENTANKKWVGKVIEVSGTISSVNESTGYVSITLKTPGEGGINCSIAKADLGSNNKLKNGDSLIVKGKCTGYLMDVNLVDCVIKK
jgi:hypothetical protein